MAKDSKFGTFGGVFTPSILTILGVIMYLRLPWVVGNAGLYAGLGIILVAHVISVCTGLSVSSIATDKSVGAGGPYYIISRSLGLPIGGALGLSLFLGLSFSISLYVIGFCESFLAYFELPAGPDAIRIAGTVTVVALTIVTLISTAFAIKTQYVIMAAIALSLVSIALASPPAVPAAPALAPHEASPTLGTLFGIFFPAVTGFTAGVNMSGDLRDPKRAIPRGTMAAIGVGAVVYVALAVFLAYRVPRNLLVEDTTVLVHVARVPELVVAGIWGATLSSALGSILGAPRILQALSVDKVTPRVFARGYGPTNEPRNALVVAFLIGEAGILIAELDAIARIVSMVFLTTYAVLNLSAFIESWASPDFHPEFRIPKSVSLLGFVTAVVVMIQLDLAAMLGAMAVMGGLFFYLQRKQLRLESGDTWEGLWATVVRAGLYRLTRARPQQRNWRPNLLLFTTPDDPHRPALVELARALVAGSGIATHFDVTPQAQGGPSRRAEADPSGLAIFHRRVEPAGGDLVETMLSACRFHGMAGVEPNTVLADWYALRDDPERLLAWLEGLSRLDVNALLYAPAPVGLGARRRIDVWWEPTSGHLALCLALTRFVTADASWAKATVRVLLVVEDTADVEPMRVAASQLLHDMRIDAVVRVVDNSLRARGYLDWIRDESGDADLTVTGLPAGDAEILRNLVPLVEELGTVLIVRAAPSFRELLRAPRAASAGEGAEGQVDLAELSSRVAVPAHPQLAAWVRARTEAAEELGRRAFDDGMVRLTARTQAHLGELADSVERNFAVLEKGLGTTNRRRLRSLVNRVQSAFLNDARALESTILTHDLEDGHSRLSALVEAALEEERFCRSKDPVARVLRPREDFAPRPEDDRELRWIKRRKRWSARLRGGAAPVTVPVRAADRWLHHALAGHVLRDVLRGFVTAQMQVALELGKLMNASRTSLGLLLEDPSSGDAEAFVRRQKEAFLSRIAGLDEAIEAERRRLVDDFVRGAAKALGEYGEMLDRIDVARTAEQLGRRTKKLEPELGALPRIPDRWAEGQRAIVRRAELGIELSHFHHRLAVAALRARETVQVQVRGGPMHDCARLRDALAPLQREGALAGDDPAVRLVPPGHAPIDHKAHVEDLQREVELLVRQLPETFETVPDEVLQALAEGAEPQLSPLEVAVRRLAQYVCQNDFIARVDADLRTIAHRERDAGHVAQDVCRLVDFHVAALREAPAEERGEAREQLAAVVERSVERLDAAVRAVTEALDGFSRGVPEWVREVIEHTAPYELARSGRGLSLSIRAQRRKGAVERARDVAGRALSRLRDRGVRLLYRHGAQARAALGGAGRTSEEEGMVQRVLAAVEPRKPAPGVLSALPFHYRQLFMSGSPPGESFWVPRPDLEARADRAVDRFLQGTAGMVIVTGDGGSGKTALIERMATRAPRGALVFRVQAPQGRLGTPAVLEAAIRSATGRQGSLDAVLDSLPDGSLLVLDDLETWWVRGPDGWRIVETVASMVDRHGGRLLIVVGIHKSALRAIDPVVALRARAVEVLTCGPVGAEAVEKAILLRHWSSGCTFEVDGRHEKQLSALASARLFSSVYARSSGNIGAALHAWVASVADVEGQHLSMVRRSADRLSILGELPAEWDALLAQVVLHKRLDEARLRALRGLPERDRALLPVLERAGLVVGGWSRGYRLDPFVGHALLRHLAAKEVLP